MKLTDKQEETIRFAYNTLYADYSKAKRMRDEKYKRFALPRYVRHLRTMQKIMTDLFEMNVEFKNLGDVEEEAT